MANATNYLKNKMIDHMLRGVAWTPPSTLYVALYTTNPTPADSATEVSGGSYARQSITLAAEVSGATENTNLITFPAATVSWGSIAYYVIKDASSGGNGLIFGAFTSAKTIDIGDILSIPIGDFDLSAS